MNVSIGSIIAGRGHELLEKRVFKKGVHAEMKRRHQSKPMFVRYKEITDVHHLHGDRFSYELRQEFGGPYRTRTGGLLRDRQAI